MSDELTERLKSHARAFDSLLSLIPAKVYYGEDVSDQWKRKKQTPEQKRAAKKAKLDPDNWKSAKDVMDERDAAATLKRKREADAENSDDAVDAELPLAVQPMEKKSKRRKVEAADNLASSTATKPESKPSAETEEEKRRRKAEQEAAKRERKQARQAKAKEKKEKLKQKKKQANGENERPRKERNTKQGHAAANDQSEESSSDEEDAETIEIDADVAKSFSAINEADGRPSASPSPIPESVLSPPIHSASSSISSVQAPSVVGEVPAAAKSSIPTTPAPTEQTAEEKAAAKDRFATRLSELRAARKANDPEKKPGSRQELLDQRRRKDEAAKKAKKEQRRKEKEEELRKQEAEIAKRFSPGGSGSLLGSPRSPMIDDNSNFSFSRVAFGDGTQADATLSGLLDPKRARGPADAATALQAAQNKAKRVAGYDPVKRQEIAEKDMWLNAKKKAHGERVRDDTSLLKKALKRQEGNKKRSEKEWGERIDGVQRGQELRQKKRTENLAKRRDEKGGASGGGGKKKMKAKKVKRPGFEGSFRGRTGGGGGKKK